MLAREGLRVDNDLSHSVILEGPRVRVRLDSGAEEGGPMVHDLREDERELAGAILEGSKRRTDQAFGDYYRGRNSSCALGAAYEGIYRLPDTADGVRPQRLDRLFECLEGVVRICPEGCKKKLPLGALIVHLNDAHHWTRERIAAWVADPDVPQDESHAHH
jgi:hypothetical protein